MIVTTFLTGDLAAQAGVPLKSTSNIIFSCIFTQVQNTGSEKSLISYQTYHINFKLLYLAVVLHYVQCKLLNLIKAEDRAKIRGRSRT